MTVRQIKHRPCDSIVTLKIKPMIRTDRATGEQATVPTPTLHCATCQRDVTMDELEPQGAVCVLFTQK